MKCTAVGLSLLVLCCPASPISADESHGPAVRLGPAVQSVQIERGELSVLFRDNSDSPRLLSGLQSLFNTRHAPGYDAYDPENPGSSAGLNFEHVISGHRNRHNKFTPRHGRYTLHRLSGEHSVRLVRDPADSPWKMAGTLDYTVTEPNCIDFEFRCTPQDARLFGSRGYGIFFFANYMNDVADHRLHFRGVEKPGGQEKWIAAEAPREHADWNGGGTYRHVDAKPLEYDDDVEFRLNTWSYDWPRFTTPFYYGIAENGMVLILMFDKTCSEADEIRFSLFKFKLNKHPRPAWDFQYVIHQVETGRPYGFKARLVWKKFVSPEDCLQEYQTWAAKLSQR